MPGWLVQDRALVLKEARLWIVIYGTLDQEPRATDGLQHSRALPKLELLGVSRARRLRRARSDTNSP